MYSKKLAEVVGPPELALLNIATESLRGREEYALPEIEKSVRLQIAFEVLGYTCEVTGIVLDNPKIWSRVACYVLE
jgi:hypothetical protein